MKLLKLISALFICVSFGMHAMEKEKEQKPTQYYYDPESKILPKELYKELYKFITNDHRNPGVWAWLLKHQEYLKESMAIKDVALNGHKAAVTCIALHSAQNKLFSGSNDNTIKVWDLVTNKCLQTILIHKKPISCLLFNKACNYLYAAAGRLLKVWDIKNQKCVKEIVCSDAISCMALDLVNNQLLVGVKNRTIVRIDLASYDYMPEIHTARSVVSIAVDHKNNCFYYAAEGITLVAVHQLDTAELQEILRFESSISTLITDQMNNRLIAGSDNGNIYVCNFTKKTISILKGHYDLVWNLEINAPCNCLFSTGSDKIIRVWDLLHNKLVHTFELENPVFMTCFDSINNVLVTASSKGPINLISLENKEIKQQIMNPCMGSLLLHSYQCYLPTMPEKRKLDFNKCKWLFPAYEQLPHSLQIALLQNLTISVPLHPAFAKVNEGFEKMAKWFLRK